VVGVWLTQRGQAVKEENFMMHRILNLKEDKEARQVALQAQKDLVVAKRERDKAREICDQLRDEDEVACKLLTRITALESENEGLTQMVDKMVQQVMELQMAAA
jgi:hypothetical protein